MALERISDGNTRVIVVDARTPSNVEVEVEVEVVEEGIEKTSMCLRAKV